MCDGVGGAEGPDTEVPSLSRAVPTVWSSPPPPPVPTSLPLLVLAVLGEAGEDMVALDLWPGLVLLPKNK